MCYNLTMKIEKATDWQDVHTKLRSQMLSIGYNPDLQRMLNNITNMVSELSNLEVDARRTRIEHYSKEKVNEINKAIDHLEKLLLIAQLMR
jgi:hypothetical protein